MLILGTGLLAHYLTFIKLFIMSFYWNGGGYQSPLLIVVNSTDKLSKITVQKRLENLYHPPGHFHFPIWAKTKFRGQRSSKILGSIPDLQVGGKRSMSLLSPYHHYSHKCLHSRLLLSCVAVLVKNRESTLSLQWGNQYSVIHIRAGLCSALFHPSWGNSWLRVNTHLLERCLSLHFWTIILSIAFCLLYVFYLLF